MVRITSERQGAKSIVHVAGQLRGADVPVLDETCEGITSVIEIDLTELREIDDDGATAIRGLQERGARLTGASPYIRLRVEAAGSRK